MAAQPILGCLSLTFLGMAIWRFRRERSLGPASRTWFLIGAIFGVVSLATWVGHAH